MPDPKVALGKKAPVNGVALKKDTAGPAPVAQSTNPGEDCMKKLAEVASAKTGLTVVFASQNDSSRMMMGTAIHPLQSLENVHQHIVRDAGRKASLKDRLEMEKAALDGYFIDDAGAPELLVPRRRPDAKDITPLLETVFNDAVDVLSRIDSALGELGTSKADKDRVDLLQTKLLDVAKTLEIVRKAFPNQEAPLLQQAKDKLATVEGQLRPAKDWAALRKVAKDTLGAAAKALGTALSGIARVQMFYDIDAFYLFRLLVRFKVEANKAVSEDEKKAASGALTAALNNQRAYLIKLLSTKLVELADVLAKKGDVFFHLKGGRALAYLLRKPESGENDWDTTIVINPDLPADKWYEKFFEVHDIVLKMLTECKREFFSLIHQNQADVMKTLTDMLPLGQQQQGAAGAFDEQEDLDYPDTAVALKDFSDSLFAKQSAACKAELIDIGIPRRDTVEAFDQWLHTKNRIIRADWTANIPIPGHLYHIDEYTIMIREVLDGVSQSPTKSAKRIIRLYEMLSLDLEKDGFGKAIDAESAHIPKDLVPESLKLIGQQSTPIKNLLTVILKQFAEAYEVKAQGAELAKIFDAMFVGAKAGKKPQAIDDSIKNIGTNFKAEHQALLDWIAKSKDLSDQLATQERNRARFFGFSDEPTDDEKKRRALLTRFIRTLYTKSAFTQEEGVELEVQPAVTGSYAAYLHADYRYLSPLKAQEFEPVTTIDLKYFCFNPEVKAEAVFDVFIKKPLEAAIGELGNQDKFTMEIDVNNEQIRLYWPSKVTISGQEYTPLAIRLSLVRGGPWPQLAFIWGLPVLSLRDLIREYDRRSAAVEEFGAKQGLRKTSTLLKEMLTEFDNLPPRGIPVAYI
jgi:hypothetical protein